MRSASGKARTAAALLLTAAVVAGLAGRGVAGAAERPDPDAAGSRSYLVAGTDTFDLGNGTASTEATLRGAQLLRWKPVGTAMRYTDVVVYRITEDGRTTSLRARYVSDLTAAGEQHDAVADDPDYLSVLNQPFSVRLDLPTLAEVSHLRTDVPFDFPSPMTGTALHGRLRDLGPRVVDGRRAIGVGFAAEGPMSGDLPGRPGFAVRGTIVLSGDAAYDARTALLLETRTTVTIEGNVVNRASSDAVRIVYARSIRSVSAEIGARPAPRTRATRSPAPRPRAPATPPREASPSEAPAVSPAPAASAPPPPAVPT